MSFYTPLMLIFALLVAAPIWLHLFGAKRAKVVDFAAIDFLLGTDRKISRAIRLRELLLLLARAIVFLIVPLIVAKPFVRCQATGVTAHRGPQGAVIIIDNSAPSLYKRSDEPLLTTILDQAATLLSELGSEADVAILTTTTDDGSEDLTREHLRHKDELRNIRPLARQARTTETLDRAARLLTRSPHQNNQIFLITAGTKSSLEGVSEWTARNPEHRLSVLLVDEESDLPNAAVTAMSINPSAEAGARGILVEATIRGFGTGPDRETEAQLTINGAVVAKKTATISEQRDTTVSFTAVLGEDARTARIEVTIASGDGLATDDRRFLISRARDTIRVLLVNGDPRTTRHVDELFYARAALERNSREFVSVETTADELADTDLGTYDVIVLANARAPEGSVAAALQEFARAGGGVFIACGDRVEPAAYNRQLGALLPQELATVYDATLGRDDDADDRRSLRLVKLELEHPIFKVFGQRTDSIIDASFKKVALLGPATASSSRVVLARYDNGAAAVVEGKLGLGRILLFTSTLDRDWNDLAIHTGYVPLIDQVLRYLGRGGQGERRQELITGEPTFIEVGPSDEQLTVEHPSGASTILDSQAMRGRDQVRFYETAEPGFYSVTASLSTGGVEPRPEASFAVNIEPGISDLTRVERQDIPRSRAQASSSKEALERRVELWHVLGCALLLLLIFESLLVLRN